MGRIRNTSWYDHAILSASLDIAGAILIIFPFPGPPFMQMPHEQINLTVLYSSPYPPPCQPF